MSAAEVVHEFIAEQVGWNAGLPMREQALDLLNALRAAAGGADQVVIRWETTTCPECEGTGKRRGSCFVCNDRRIVDQNPCLECSTSQGEARPCALCGGSGRGPEAVTLHRLEPVGPIDEHTWISRTHHEEQLYGLVPVDVAEPKEKHDA